jgi:hypothetical protein
MPVVAGGRPRLVVALPYPDRQAKASTGWSSIAFDQVLTFKRWMKNSVRLRRESEVRGGETSASHGHPYAIFRRALEHGNLLVAEALGETPPVSAESSRARRPTLCLDTPWLARASDSFLSLSSQGVATAGNLGWSLYRAPWLQPVAISRKSDWRGTRENKPKPLPWVAANCRAQRMVRRGSTVRVRQRASR